jgi:26S proteasome regulatory subunit N2
VRALQRIYQIIDVHWAEICNSLPLIEELSENTEFPAADLAAAIASKCFYHLQEYKDALRLALCAGKYLDISTKSEYIDTILAQCIDEYKTLRAQFEADPTSVTIDPRMEHIVEQMFQRCYRDRCFEQAIGVALDTRRIDKVEEVVATALKSGREQILGYIFSLCQNARNITPREFRLSVIEVLVKHYGTLAVPDYSNVCFGLQYLNRPKEAADTLVKLLHGSIEDTLLAYQIAFDLQETENQGFVLQVVAAFPSASPSPTPAGEGAPATDAVAPATAAPEDEQYSQRMANLRRILVDGLDIDLTLNFLFKQSHADVNVLNSIKTAIEGRSNVLHNSTIVAHAYMNSGTTRDTFLRENLEWLGKAKNWAKFTTVGSIGVVHKGHVHESMTLLQPYLPQGGQSASPYSESGALYALGLIHANKGGSGDSATITYLTEALRNGGNNEIVQHGACLGIGLAAMATGNEELFENLRAVLFTDSAVAGEGAALAIGLVMLGQSDSPLAQNVLPDLLNYLHDTQHEKIIRALSLSVAMMVYGKEESADVIIEQLSRDRDPIVRYGAMYAVAMAYCGTADNKSIRKLLHVAVSDVNDDVRRAAVSCIGFLMFRSPESVPKLVSLLAESFNPHVRYGACIAIGVACAGTAFKDAIDLLTPMLEDAVDFVRQGALMAMVSVCLRNRNWAGLCRFQSLIEFVCIVISYLLTTSTCAPRPWCCSRPPRRARPP